LGLFPGESRPEQRCVCRRSASGDSREKYMCAGVPRMAVIWVAAASLIAVLANNPCLAGTQQPKNLCTNGGFEALDDKGFPKDWTVFHEGTSGEDVVIGVSKNSRSGDSSFSFVVRGAHKAGLNRRHSPGTDIGGLIPLVKGVARFWYKAIESGSEGDNLRFCVIAMDEKGQSEVGRVQYVVPAAHVGDGQWHEGIVEFDFSSSSAARYVHAAPRVNEVGRASRGEILFDDIVVTKLGARLKVERFGPDKAVARVGEEILFRGSVSNVGDEAAVSVTGSVLLDGEKFGKPGTESRIGPDETAEFEWRCPVVNEMSCVAEMLVSADNLESFSAVSHVAALTERPAPADVVVEGENVKLAFGCTLYGYGPAKLLVRSESSWTEVARLMSFSRLAYRSNDGAVRRRLICGDIATYKKHRALFAKDIVDADGDMWRFRFSFTAGDDGKSILATYTVVTENDKELLAFGGPTVYVGDGTTGGEKENALFPGLEYLELDEVSSSTLDISPPGNVRRVPHPNKITIPVMAVNVREHLVGMTWDPFQKWDGTTDRPCALFSSPNRFENMGCHAMGLFLPSCPTWVAENATEAAQPYRLRAGEELELVAEIFVDYPAERSIKAVRHWIEANGVPPPLDAPRGTLEDEVGFSLAAYMRTLWVEEEQKWHNTLDWDPWPLGRNPAFVHQLLLGARRTKDEQLRELYRGRASSVLEKMSAAELGLDLAFEVGHLQEVLAGRRAHMKGLIEKQQPEGYWAFDPDESNKRDTIHHKDYHILGDMGDVEVGTCANNAYQILKFARISADSEMLAAGLKTLKYMRRFEVPRAAQVWEVPVHTPDLLACAHAVLAYTEGYRLTGDQGHLDEAVRWAWTGLPFIYLWNNDDMPYMRYASIPVFGATWFTHSWFGRAVQWNGLDYAYALLKLSEHDATLPWRKIATGITVSAMYQQDDSGKYEALYPDSYDFMTKSKAQWWLSPSGILRNVFTLLGDDPDVTTAFIEGDDERVHVNSGTKVESAGLWRRGVSFDLILPRGDVSHCVVVPVAQPDKVTASRDNLKQFMELEETDSGWTYDEKNRALFIKVVHRRERMRVVVREARE